MLTQEFINQYHIVMDEHIQHHIDIVFNPEVRLRHYRKVLELFQSHLHYYNKFHHKYPMMNKDYICTQLRIVIGEESLFGLFQSLDTWYNERYVILYPELYAVKPDWVNNILTGNWFGYAQEIPALKLRIEKLNEMINQVIPLIHV